MTSRAEAEGPGRRHEGMGPYSGKSSLALVGASAPAPAGPVPGPSPHGSAPDRARARARVAAPGGLARERRAPGVLFPAGGCDAARARRRGRPGTDRRPLAAVRAGGGGGGRDVLRVHEAPGPAVDDAQQKALAKSTKRGGKGRQRTAVGARRAQGEGRGGGFRSPAKESEREGEGGRKARRRGEVKKPLLFASPPWRARPATPRPAGRGRAPSPSSWTSWRPRWSRGRPSSPP